MPIADISPYSIISSARAETLDPLGVLTTIQALARFVVEPRLFFGKVASSPYGGSDMITEIVLFRLPEGMSREDAIAKYRLSVPAWQANPDLIRKAYLFDETSRRGGGVYHWKTSRRRS